MFLPARAFGLRLDTTQIHVCGQIKHAAVASPGTVGGPFARGNAAEQLALRRQHIDAAGSGRPEMAVLVDLETVGQPRESLFHRRGGVIDDAALAERPVFFHGEGLPDRGFGIGLGHVERFKIRRKSDAVGTRHFLGEEGELAIGSETIDAAEIEFAQGVLPPLRE